MRMPAATAGVSVTPVEPAAPAQERDRPGVIMGSGRRLISFRSAGLEPLSQQPGDAARQQRSLSTFILDRGLQISWGPKQGFCLEDESISLWKKRCTR